MSTAVVFPGQGSQIVGMGKEIADSYKEAKYVFEKIDESLKQNLSKIIFEGPIEDLTLTANTQPALMAVSMAIMAVLEKQISFQLKKSAKFCAGHSLGEYTALAAAQSFSIETAAKLLRIRGSAMQEASPIGQGAMAALIGVSIEEAEVLAQQAALSEVCQVANDNTIGQVVVSGHKNAINRLIVLAQEKGKKAIVLPVSAPFHSILMAPATQIMEDALNQIEIKAPVIPIIANVVGHPVSDPEQIKELLVKQVENRVRWRESVLCLLANEVDHFIEIGAGKVLAGLVKKINPSVKITSINNLETLNSFMEEVGILAI
jgi:[acyl-carrier-protein] S-malonyltransferase